MKIQKVHALQWVLDELAEDPTYVQRGMFGCQVALLHGKMTMAVIAKSEPWNGLLVCTSREFHDSLQKEFPALMPHEILGKWLYISQSHPDFESTGQRLAQRALRSDPRVGIEPGKRKPRHRKSRLAKPRAATKKVSARRPPRNRK